MMYHDNSRRSVNPMINHPNRAQTHVYIVTYYAPDRRGRLVDAVTEVVAATADDALNIVARRNQPWQFASFTRRWQLSPAAADRDNCHAQADGSGKRGWAVVRADVDTAAAEHRNDVEVARRWVSEGRALSELQKYGAYKSVTEQEASGTPSMPAPTDALSAVGFKDELPCV